MMLPCELICQGFHSEVFLAVCVLKHFSCVRLFATPWTVAHQAPLSVGFSRQEYWSGLIAMPSSTGSSQLKDRTHILMSPALAGQFFTASATWEAPSWLSGLNCRNLFSHSFTGQKSKIRVWAGLVPSESQRGRSSVLGLQVPICFCVFPLPSLCVSRFNLIRTSVLLD